MTFAMIRLDGPPDAWSVPEDHVAAHVELLWSGIAPERGHTMNQLRIKLVAALSCSVLHAPGWSLADRTLTLPDALQLAREHNHDLEQARARLQQAQVGIEQARVALMPTVQLQGKYTHNYKGAELPISAFNQGTVGLAQTIGAADPALAPALGNFTHQLQNASFGGLPNTIVIQKQEQLDSSLDVKVPLLVPSGWANLEASKRTYASSEASFDVTETSLLFSVAQAFFTAAGADELLLARKHAVEVTQQTLAQSQAKLSAGTAKRTDVNQAALSLLQAQQALLQAQDQRNQAYRSLATLIQLPGLFTVSVEDHPDQQIASGDPAQLTTHALLARPEFREGDKTVLADEAKISAQDWGWSPTLSAFGHATYGNYAGFTGTPYTWAVGVQLDWALYDGGNREAQKHLLQAQAAETRAKLAAERDSVRDDVQTASENLATSREGLTTSERSVALAQETLKLMRVQYEAGIATQLDVLEAQDSLVSAEVTLVQARYTLAQDALALQRNAGLFPEEIAAKVKP